MSEQPLTTAWRTLPDRTFNLRNEADFAWLADYFSGYHGVPRLRARVTSLDGEAIERAIAAATPLVNPRLSEVPWDDVAATLDAARAGVPGDEGLRAALEDIASLYNDNRTRPASFAIQAGEIAVKALAASPAPAGLEAERLAEALGRSPTLRRFVAGGAEFNRIIAEEVVALASPDSERPA